MSGQWISAKDALKIVSPDGDRERGAWAIWERACAGMVKAEAEKFTYQNLTEKRWRDADFIPLIFWSSESLAGHRQNWEQGDFTFSVGPIQCKAFGVIFDRDDIFAMLPSALTMPSPVQPDPANSKGPRHNPGKYDWARAVGSTVFHWADSGAWRPTSQGEVQTKLADWFSDIEQVPDDKLLKRYAKWLIQEFRKRDT